jgi:ring-1,2-phenylacetyl-CoA epoxidase subunit PaaC
MDKLSLANFLIALADDQLMLGHRNSEWCGHAPILEEDIAFANIAIDELGHARVWYEIVAQLLDEDKRAYPDQLIFFRDAEDFRNVRMASLPNRDWAFTLVRQHLMDVFEMLYLELLRDSKHQLISSAAAKLINEELYHRRHTRAWLPRLGAGTEESHRRMQAAVDALWPYSVQFFLPMEGSEALIEDEWIPDLVLLHEPYISEVMEDLTDAGLSIPADDEFVGVPRTQPDQHLLDLVEEMQSVARAFPGAKW